MLSAKLPRLIFSARPVGRQLVEGCRGFIMVEGGYWIPWAVHTQVDSIGAKCTTYHGMLWAEFTDAKGAQSIGWALVYALLIKINTLMTYWKSGPEPPPCVLCS